MRIALLLPLFVLSLAGCSTTSSSVGSAGASVYSGSYYGSHYGSYPWWYDDYYYYWDDYYPWCCDNEGDFDELIKKWWNGLDEERQQEIKDKYQDWQENGGQPDVGALRQDFATRWNAMTAEQKQALRDNRQHRPSLSNPDKSPRSALDYKAGALTPGALPKVDSGALTPGALPKADNGALTPTTLPKADNGALTPTTLPKADNGALTPTTLPKADNGALTPTTLPRVDTGTQARPHLPASLVTPSRSLMRPSVRPPMRSFPGIRRR